MTFSVTLPIAVGVGIRGLTARSSSLLTPRTEERRTSADLSRPDGRPADATGLSGSAVDGQAEPALAAGGVEKLGLASGPDPTPQDRAGGAIEPRPLSGRETLRRARRAHPGGKQDLQRPQVANAGEPALVGEQVSNSPAADEQLAKAPGPDRRIERVRRVLGRRTKPTSGLNAGPFLTRSICTP